MQKASTYDKAEILRMVKGIVSLVLPNAKPKLFVFGSQAGLNEWKQADVDLGIDAGEPIDWKKLSTIKDLIAALPVMYRFDVIDFNRVSDRFKVVATKNIEPI